MRVFRKSVAASSLVLSVFLATSAHAQFIPQYPGPGVWIMPALLNPCNHSIDCSDDSTTQNDTEENSPVTPSNAVSLFTYTLSLSLRRENLANFSSKLRVADPARAEQMGVIFSSGDVIADIDGLMQSMGMSAGNTADAWAIWWIGAWQVASGDNRPFNASVYKAVSAQAARAMTGSPEFANATDAQKQEMAENMLLQTALISASKGIYAGDRAMLQKLGTDVKQGAKRAGIDLDAMTLTEDGFVPVKGK
jgi:hypothetical protein